MTNPYQEPVYTANNANDLNPTPRDVDVLESIDTDLKTAVIVSDLTADAADGTTADTAWSGTGNSTVIAALKGIFGKLAGILSVNLSQIGGATLSASNGVPIYDAYLAPQTASWTSATAVNTALTFNTAGMDTLGVTLNTPATFTNGVLTFQIWDGTTWMAIKCPRAESYSTDQTFSMAGVASSHTWQIPVAGFPQARILLSTAIAGSGTATLVGIVSSTPDTSLVTVGLDPSQPLPVGTNTLGNVNQTAATAGFSKTTDGTNVAAVKAASTAAVATDPAAVVALSPNTGLPAGTNAIGAVTGQGAQIAQTPTIQAAAYSAGNIIGAPSTFANALPSSFNGILQSITLAFKGSVQTGLFQVAVFSATPTGTFTDKAAPAIATADSANLIGVYSLSTPVSSLGTHTVFNLDGIGKQIKGASTSLYAVVICQTALSANPASTTDMIVTLGVLW